jgi:hypothetical protein
MNSIVLQLDPSPGNGRNSEGAFVTLNDGRILFAYTKYVTQDNEDAAPSIIASRVSSDGGQTWSNEDRILVERGDAQNVMSVSLLRLKSGRILMLYLQKNCIADGMACTPFVRFSDDEMETLSEPVAAIPMQEYHCVNNDRIVQLQSGRLVIPVAQHRVGVQRFSNAGMIFYLLSDDEGETWTESTSSYYRCFPDKQGWQEPGVVELNDGRLWSWMRTGWNGGERCGRQWESFSSDGGETWSEPQASQFVSPYSPLSMKRIPSTGDLLAVWNDHSGRFPTPSYERKTWDGADWGIHRTPLSCAISRDEGSTFEQYYLLEDAPDHGFCYTAIHFGDDAVLLAYCAGGVTTGSVLDRLRMRRISLAELYGAA